MIKINTIKAFWRHVFNVSSFFLYLFRLGLIFLLGFLSLFLAGLYFNVKIDLPTSLEDFLEEELKKEGFVLKSKSIKFDLRANIIVEDASLSFVATASDFLSAKRLGFGISLESIWEKKIVLDYAFVEDATLSPANVDESDLSLLSKIYLRASRKADIWSVYNFKANLGGLQIYADGNLDRRFFDKASSEKSSSVSKKDSLVDYLVAWEEFSAKINEVKNYADKLNYPIFSLSFDVSKNKIEGLSCLFRAKDVDFSLEEHSFKLENLKLSFSLDSQDIENHKAEIFTELRNLSIDEAFSARKLSFKGEFDYKNIKSLESVYLKDFKLWVDVFNISEHKLDYMSLATSELSFINSPKGLELYLKRGLSYIDASAQISQKNIDLSFIFNENPSVFLDIPALEAIKESKVIKQISINKPVYIRGDANFYFRESIETLNLSNLDFGNFESLDDIEATAFLFGEDIDFATEHIEEVYGRIDFSLKESFISAKDILLTTSDGWSIGGSIYQGIEPLDYMFELAGAFEPVCLDEVMAPWWKMVFGNFELLTYPEVEVFINGKWGDPEFTWVYAKVDAEKAKYHSYTFEDISLLLNVNPAIICAYNVKLKDGDGVANARLSWVYDPKFGLENYLYRNIVASVNMNFDAVKALGGDDVEEIVEIISFEDNISLSFDLYAPNPRREPNGKQKIDFEFDANSLVKVSYFDFDTIKGKGKAIGDSFYIKDVEASFLDGDLAGDFSLEHIDEKHYFKTNLEAKDLNQGKLIDLIFEITKGEDSPKNTDKSSYLGKVASSLSAEGFLLDFNSYKGQASISIENPELQKVSILGGISRALEVFSIPLTTLEFTSFNGDFTIGEGKIFFPKLEIKSQTSNLFGKAIYTAMTDEVSARMYFNWKIANSIPILGHLADFAFDPILDSILLVISDTFSHPSFSARIRPFNIFNSSEDMLNNIDADSL